MNIRDLLNIFTNLLDKKDKRKIIFLLSFSIFVSLVETLSLSIVMPFISVATNFDLIYKNDFYHKIYSFLGLQSPLQFISFLGAFLVVFFLFRSLIYFIFSYILSNFAQGKYHSFACYVFNNYLNFNYSNFVSENSSSVYKAIFSDASSLTQIITCFLQISTEILTGIFIYSALLFVDWKMTLALTFFLGIQAFGLMKFITKRVAKEGKKSGAVWQILSRTLSETVGNFKLIKLFSNEGHILKRFESASYSLAKSGVINKILQDLPRVILESLGFFTMVGMILFILWTYRDSSAVLPIISIYALAFYRLLPSLSRIFTYYNQMLYAFNSLGSYYLELPLKVESLGNQKINFGEKIEFKNIFFGHEKNKILLKNIDFIIEKNQKVAFIGESGAGKSTILDIIMGFYPVKNGEILIDNKILDKSNLIDWRMKIGYIPQQVYLLDGTVAENVVFGRTYNEELLIDSLVKANIYDFLLTKNGVDTIVGEGGIMLSGGQKQRIAIARALYSNPQILILDEATSALDTDIESKIMDEIYSISNQKTLIVVAHRLSTIARCEKIFKIEKGNIFEVDFSTKSTNVILKVQ
ncbi:TPA: ABC transporter ATP-binding protein [Candidatus Dependentiae bacterium]|nr:MAG: Wlab protein [candidate division TM6 bacterium GW2011_GWE2_31_21]KKP53910.1 MAG: Wlab protein [candidate division TM6 bacterium GW2011_GWF2_33_332]HBS47690.1 ABC transporter ATP-binding protein [Candidatus Dependentiae bacterium]HBZ73839.1 ABC transporter ATP-binding protein [Candidatus Dependentiae bacterium]